MFTKESLEKLRERIDLVEALETHVDLKRAGSAYKALCPFHQEKTPSFVVQKGDTHYHCFGCGAHGDAIQFLMNYLNLSFVEAVESLAERFHLPLERDNHKEGKGIDKRALKESLERASRFFHEFLLFSEEGRPALHYLFQRGISIDFIRRFEIGYAPSSSLIFKVIKDEEALAQTGLIHESGRPFFRERITFPVREHSGRVIGFSARKIREETFGGKYINTPETPLFKKSRTLFGLNHSRRRIAKERRVILVEGQIDCLRLIESGLDLTVAALGTAFGESHVALLKQLGVRQAYLLFDGDAAGAAAASKTGDLFQKAGVEVFVVSLPSGSDPDSFLNRFGTEPLLELLDKAESYLAFQVTFLGREINLNSPAGKAELVKIVKKQMVEWEDPVMVHESLRKLASMVHLPEEMIGFKLNFSPNLYIKKQGTHPFQQFDPDRVLELDLLRWLILMNEKFHKTAARYLTESHFCVPACRSLFKKIIEKRTVDLLSLAADLEDPEIIDEILKKKVNRERAEGQFLETVQKILDRKWMQTREEIKREIHSGKYSEEEVLALAKRFDELRRETCIII
ncbi:MAG: DNA primase [Chlamydiales bacterium]|nr:DNA primase [Chlamydiales bacterium]